MLQIIIAEHLPSPADVKALSHTCRDLHGLIASPAFVAAWLWSTHGVKAPFLAVEEGDLPVLRRLVEVHHADVNGSDAEGGGLTLLCYACRHGQADFVSYFLSVPGIDANKALQAHQQSEDMLAPLHAACMSGRVDCVRQLLSHPGVHVNVDDGHGNTPLGLAVACGDRPLLDVIRELHPLSLSGARQG